MKLPDAGRCFVPVFHGPKPVARPRPVARSDSVCPDDLADGRGLAHNPVRATLQARDGYLWLGTYGGLVRFDGVRFRGFKPVTTRNGLVDDAMWSTLEEGEYLWMSSDRGVFRVSRRSVLDVRQPRRNRGASRGPGQSRGESVARSRPPAVVDARLDRDGVVRLRCARLVADSRVDRRRGPAAHVLTPVVRSLVVEVICH